MTEIREIYQIPQSKDLNQVINNLNFILQRIADRLDKFDGLRGSARDASIPTSALTGNISPSIIEAGTMNDVLISIADTDDTVIHQVGNE